MIRKSDIVEAVRSIDHDVTRLSIKVEELSREVQAIKVNIKNVPKNKKAEKAMSQTRDASGKFAKK